MVSGTGAGGRCRKAGGRLAVGRLGTAALLDLPAPSFYTCRPAPSPFSGTRAGPRCVHSVSPSHRRLPGGAGRAGAWPRAAGPQSCRTALPLSKSPCLSLCFSYTRSPSTALDASIPAPTQVARCLVWSERSSPVTRPPTSLSRRSSSSSLSSDGSEGGMSGDSSWRGRDARQRPCTAPSASPLSWDMWSPRGCRATSPRFRARVDAEARRATTPDWQALGERCCSWCCCRRSRRGTQQPALPTRLLPLTGRPSSHRDTPTCIARQERSGLRARRARRSSRRAGHTACQ